MSLTQKVAIVISVEGLLGVLAVGLLIYLNTSSGLKNSVYTQQLSTASLTINEIDRRLFEAQRGIDVISSVKVFENYLSGSIKDQKLLAAGFNNIQQNTGPWDLIRVIDARGVVVGSDDNKYIGHNASEFSSSVELYKKALLGSKSNTDLIISDTTNKPTIFFAAPIRDTSKADQPIIGVVIANFPYSELTGILKGIRSEAHLFNSKGYLIGGSSKNDSQFILQKNSDTNTLIKKAEAGQDVSAVGTGTDNEVNALLSAVKEKGYMSYPGNGWVLDIETSSQDAFAEAYASAVQSFIALAVLITALTIAFVFFIRRIFIRPLLLLNEITNKIAAGDLSQRLKINSNDEVGQVSKSFNLMADNLVASAAELKQKVTSRTNELQEKLSDLEKMNELMINREIKMADLKKKLKDK